MTAVETSPAGLQVSFQGGKAPDSDIFDRVLVAVGRRPNGRSIGAENAGVIVDERGYIGLAEGKVAAEVAAGKASYFDAKVIPSVAYTDAEVAWVGVTENEAKAAGVKYGKGVFPWAASGRSLSPGRDEGMTKLLSDETNERVIGAALVAEVVHAIEMGADATGIGLTIHAHPTLSETVGLAAEAFEGTTTDLYLPKKR